MGWGDEIMASGEARRAFEQEGRPVAICGADGRPRWHAAWHHLGFVATPEQVNNGVACMRIVNGGNARPYVRAKTAERYRFEPRYRAVVGSLRFSAREAAFAAAAVADAGLCPGQGIVIEPNVLRGGRPNKDWGWHRWQALVELAPQLPWWQLGPPEAPTLDGVRRIVTPGFREASAVLALARAAVLPEGGLHHAAAALGLPAVVIFGGFIAPAITGYAGHRNLARLHDDNGAGCGWRVPCAACAAAMAAIAPGEALKELEGLLHGVDGSLGCRRSEGFVAASAAKR